MTPKLELIPIVLDIETTGLDSLEHEIVAIGLKWSPKAEHSEILLRQPPQYLAEESDLLSEMNKVFFHLQAANYDANRKLCLVGYNITKFDLPFIHARASKHGIDTSYLRSYYRVDLMSIVQRYILTSKRNASLANICDFFGIERDSEFSGALVPEFWKKGEYDKIYLHLLRDLKAEWQLFERLRDLCAHNLKVRYNLNCEVVWRY